MTTSQSLFVVGCVLMNHWFCWNNVIHYYYILFISSTLFANKLFMVYTTFSITFKDSYKI